MLHMAVIPALMVKDRRVTEIQIQSVSLGYMQFQAYLDYTMTQSQQAN